MLRLIGMISVSLLAAGCETKPSKKTEVTVGSASAGSGSQAAAAPVAKPASTLAQIEAWAPKGSKVAPADLKATGVELFAVTVEKPTDEDFPAGGLVGVVEGAGGKVVEGRELVSAVAQGKADATTLARVAMWNAQDDGDLLTAAATPEQRKAKVGAPTIKGGALTFWVWTTDDPRILERGSVDLTTGGVELGPLPVKPDVMISNAIKTLLGSSVRRHVGAIQVLAALCTNPRARQSLLAALSSHPRDRTRAAVTDEIHKCGAAAVDPLIYSMENDKAAMVRTRAAGALGRVGDGRARPALAKAARSEDANLVWAAKNALGKLK
jgi:HEAT repeats